MVTPFDGSFTTGFLLLDHFFGRLGDELLIAELLVDLGDFGIELVHLLWRGGPFRRRVSMNSAKRQRPGGFADDELGRVGRDVGLRA